jgi:4-aminobutyrate aminotransferase-like enzyme
LWERNEVTDRTRGLDDAGVVREHIMRDFSVQSTRVKTVHVGGEGCWARTQDGRRLLDFKSNASHMNLGHQHSPMVATITRKRSRRAGNLEVRHGRKRSRYCQELCSGGAAHAATFRPSANFTPRITSRIRG